MYISMCIYIYLYIYICIYMYKIGSLIRRQPHSPSVCHSSIISSTKSLPEAL